MNLENLHLLSSLDIYLSKTKIPNHQLLPQKRHPLNSLDIFAESAKQLRDKIRRKKEVEILNAWGEKFNWNFNFNFVVESDYEALVLTNRDQTILWTNKGFSKMTGYPANFAIGKKPGFLQGIKTSAEKKLKLKTGLQNNKSFSEVLKNYRKDGEEYLCKIDIYPITSPQNEVTHFLALEKEVYTIE